MGGFAWWHWLIIAAAFLLLFGAKRLPETARGVGRSLRIFNSEIHALHEDATTAVLQPAADAQTAPLGGTAATPSTPPAAPGTRP